MATLDEIIEAIGVEPYHREPAGVIYCADCLDILPKIPEKSIDLVLTDPPYGVNLQYGSGVEDTASAWDSRFLLFMPELLRLAQMSILPSCQIKKLEFIYKHHPPDWLIAWYKGSPGHAAFVGFNDWEPHLVYGKKSDLCMHDYFQTSLVPADSIPGHPCPKPIQWARWLIRKPTIPSDLILDPFLGSGTTAVAAKQLGRKFVGVEIEDKYCKIAVDRLRQEELF